MVPVVTEITRALKPVTRDTFIGNSGGGTSARQPPIGHQELATVVRAARGGDHIAWSSLVRRFDRTLRAIARSYRLAPADVDDVVQASWLNLLEGIDDVREPAAIAGWLATVTRRNAMRVRQAHVREEPTDDPLLGDRVQLTGPELDVLAAERREVLGRAVALLPERHRRLMTVLIARPTLDYGQVGELLSMPVGSIGPIRARSLMRLSRDPQVRELCDDANCIAS
jgi:RNA polymerase sigma factor (sigma-70 family)